LGNGSEFSRATGLLSRECHSPFGQDCLCCSDGWSPVTPLSRALPDGGRRPRLCKNTLRIPRRFDNRRIKTNNSSAIEPTCPKMPCSKLASDVFTQPRPKADLRLTHVGFSRLPDNLIFRASTPCQANFAIRSR
jgi:hypothetical protein